MSYAIKFMVKLTSRTEEQSIFSSHDQLLDFCCSSVSELVFCTRLVSSYISLSPRVKYDIISAGTEVSFSLHIH